VPFPLREQLRRGSSTVQVARPALLNRDGNGRSVRVERSNSKLILDLFWEDLIASAPILLLISSACGYWFSRRALRPVDRITAAARSISIRNLSERVPVSRTGDEIERLAETCNAMLARAVQNEQLSEEILKSVRQKLI
jgi:nitrogen fixation/metabolism regulation signal transduction histidine kinase